MNPLTRCTSAAAAAAADSSPAADAATRLPGAIRIRKPTVSAGSRARTTALRLRARTAVRAPRAMRRIPTRQARPTIPSTVPPAHRAQGMGMQAQHAMAPLIPPVVATRARLPAHLPERRSPGSNGPVAFDRRAAIKHVRGAVEIRGSRAYRENGRTEAHSDRSGIPRGKFPIIRPLTRLRSVNTIEAAAGGARLTHERDVSRETIRDAPIKEASYEQAKKLEQVWSEVCGQVKSYNNIDPVADQRVLLTPASAGYERRVPHDHRGQRLYKDMDRASLCRVHQNAR